MSDKFEEWLKDTTLPLVDDSFSLKKIVDLLKAAWNAGMAAREELKLGGMFCPICGSSCVADDTGWPRCSEDKADVLFGCPDILAVQKLLSDMELEHVVNMEQGRFFIKHPLRERINDALLDCRIHGYLEEYDQRGILPKGGGVYRVKIGHPIRNDLVFERLR